MSAKSIEENENYQKEFFKFLIKRIKNAGGSLNFQDLCSIFQQLRFEIRQTFGTKKSLMEFLRSRPDIFDIDAKKFSVTLVSSSALEDFEEYDSVNITDKNSNITPIKIWPPLIENGTGIIIKIYTEFGVIKASEPIETYVYFTPAECSKNKDSLLTDIDIDIRAVVSFNAVFGHQDYSINYRATKVRQIHDSDESHKHKKVNKKLNVRDVSSVTDTEVETSLFNKDRVNYSNRHSKPKAAAEVIKKSEKCYNQSSHDRTNDKNTVKKRLENQVGKIWPFPSGTIIKFGKDYSELVDGGSCEYFLYGTRLFNIQYEFSEGDEIFFDAVKIEKAPGWKAVLVWRGKKPDRNSIKNIDEIYDKISEDENCASNLVVSPESSCSSVKSRTMKCKSFNTSLKKTNISPDYSVKKKDIKSNVKCKQDNSEYSKRHPQKNHMNKTNKNFHADKCKVKSVDEITEKSNFNYENGYSSKKTIMKRNILGSSQNTSDEDNKFESITHNPKNFTKANKGECSINTHRFKFKHGSEDQINIDKENYETTLGNLTNNKEGETSIKMFEDIDGKITLLYCKAAFVKSSHFQTDIDFVLNTFYLSGKSVEEQQVIDLKEVIKVGDVIRFNGFEIIDDEGNIHQKITLAWKGPKPVGVIEMTPEEFIQELNLKVSLNNNLDNENIEEYNTKENNFPTDVNCRSFDYTFNCDSSSLEDNISEDENNISKDMNDVSEDMNDVSEDMNDVSEDMNDVSEDMNDVSEDMNDASKGMNDVSEEYIPRYSAKNRNEMDENLSLNVHYKLVSEKIIQRLTRGGFISSKVDLNSAREEVNTVLKNSDIEGSATLNQEASLKGNFRNNSSDCASRTIPFTRKRTDAEVQTVITGEIVATRDDLSFVQRKRTFHKNAS